MIFLLISLEQLQLKIALKIERIVQIKVDRCYRLEDDKYTGYEHTRCSSSKCPLAKSLKILANTSVYNKAFLE